MNKHYIKYKITLIEYDKKGDKVIAINRGITNVFEDKVGITTNELLEMEMDRIKYEFFAKLYAWFLSFNSNILSNTYIFLLLLVVICFIFGVVLMVFGSLLSTNQIQFCNRSNIFYSLIEIIKVRRCILDIFLMALWYSSYFSNLNNSGFSRFCFFNFWCIIIENTQ